jgi:hypothetical protein
MSLADFLASTLERLEVHYHHMGSAIPVPIRVKIGSDMFFRHTQQSDLLLCYLKGVKLISTLNAALILFRHGYAQEIGALCRMADDFFFEIMFFVKPLGDGGPSKDQQRMFDDFFREEFENPNDPLGSAQDRDNVPRRKINAAFGQIAKDELNPHDAQNTVSTVHKAFSGYVHGAYPHIMEMYGGNPPHFHIRGMLGTPRIREWEGQLVTYVYRAIMIAELTSHKFGLPEIEQSIRSLLVEFETELKCKPNESAEKILGKMKRKTRNP